MVTLGALWLPILLSAVIVWIASAIAWTASPHHKADFKVIPDQDDFLDNVGKRSLAPGQYWFPYSSNREDMNTPEMVAKQERGPVGLLTVWKSEKPNMAKPMILSVVFYVIVGVFVAYMASLTLSPGTEYMRGFRLTSAVAFMTYSGALLPDAIWFGTPWRRTWLTMVDGLIYALLTGGVFGWYVARLGG